MALIYRLHCSNGHPVRRMSSGKWVHTRVADRECTLKVDSKMTTKE